MGSESRSARGGALRTVTDEILVQRAIDGDLTAFEAIVLRYGPLMRAYTSRIVSHTDADDVVQETFTIAWSRLPSLRDPAALKAWLMRIASRQAFAQLEKRRPDVPLPVFDQPLPAHTQPENVAVRNAQLEALSVALDNLSVDLRRCWLLREVAGLSYDEIAGEMQLPVSTVRGILARARVSIYAQMEGWR